MNQTTSNSILVVDDNEMERKILSSVLTKNGFTPILASSGSECLSILTSSKVDLVLLDVMMPVMSGIDVLSEIRKERSQLQLPIVMVTSKSESDDIVHALKLGANDYVTKPVDFPIALLRISTQLNLTRLSQENSRLHEAAAINAMIATYNHEINNPLAIAVAAVDRISQNSPNDPDGPLGMLKRALTRITNIVKKIRDTTENSAFEYETYVGQSKTIKLKS